MRTAVGAALALFALAFAAYGQRLSLGVVGGTNLTANFPITDFSGPADAFGNPAYRFQHLTGPRSFILGALVEGHLTERFSIEANVLHRPMKTTIISTQFFDDGSSRVNTIDLTAVRAWEFPVMLKYTLPPSQVAGRIRPFLAVGPSFRTQEEGSGATEPSQFGMSAGVGAAFHLGRLRFAPTLRYTRWMRESIPSYPTKPDQVEFLASLAYETESDSRRLAGRKLGLGAVVGLPFTRGFGRTFVERTRYLAGLTAQMIVMRNLSVEVNAIYKPLRHAGIAGVQSRFSLLTWQFPVLAKYSWTKPQWTPFAEAGPSFRLAGNLGGYNPSHYGVTVGAGVERRAHGFRLSPALRYTRWAKDPPTDFDRILRRDSSFRTNPNAIEIVFGVSF